MKGKHWGKLAHESVGEGYRQVSTRTAQGKPRGKMVAVGRSKEYATNVVGSHGGKPSGKFVGQTGGNIRHGKKFPSKVS